MATKVNKNINISRDSSTYNNQYTKKIKGVDWVLRASIPGDVNRRLMAIPEFGWLYEKGNSKGDNMNEGFEKFLQLNPQFDIRYAHKRKGIVNRNVMNKDGTMWDLVTMKPVKKL